MSKEIDYCFVACTRKDTTSLAETASNATTAVASFPSTLYNLQIAVTALFFLESNAIGIARTEIFDRAYTFVRSELLALQNSQEGCTIQSDLQNYMYHLQFFLE